MRIIFRILLVATLSLVGFQSVSAQQPSNLQVNDLKYPYEFGSYIQFEGQLLLPSPPSEAFLMLRIEGDPSTRVLPLELDSNGNFKLRYDVKQNPLRPFAEINYSFRVKLLDGVEMVSQEDGFRYEDNRFKWQVLSSEGITVHWHDAELLFGQQALDVAMRGVKKADDLLGIDQSWSADIYIYSSSVELAEALEIGGLSVVGGHALPDLNLGLVAISPGPQQKLEMEQKIPHELGHVATYQLVKNRYDRLPAWLIEGIATQVELFPDPNYTLILKDASRQGNLISMKELCDSFPQTGDKNMLAYAEAQSFTRYIIDKYGQTGFLALTKSYGDGLDCELGSKQALGVQLSELDILWRSDVLGENTFFQAVKKLLPYLLILLVLLLVSSFSVISMKRFKDER